MRPIDADAIEYYEGEYPPTPCVSKKCIDSLPTIEPKRGKWETVDDWDGDCHYQCSFCGEEWYINEGTPSENNMNYCPNCGAKMERSEE